MEMEQRLCRDRAIRLVVERVEWRDGGKEGCDALCGILRTNLRLFAAQASPALVAASLSSPRDSRRRVNQPASTRPTLGFGPERTERQLPNQGDSRRGQ